MASTQHTSIAPLGKADASAPGILLVDDSREFLDLWRRVLSSHGFSVLTAAGSSEALQLLRSHHHAITAVVIDLLLDPPVLRLASRKHATTRVHGDRLAHVLTQHYPTMGIVLTSALSEREFARHGIQADLGRFPFLPKPINEARLVGELQAMVATRRADSTPHLETSLPMD